MRNEVVCLAAAVVLTAATGTVTAQTAKADLVAAADITAPGDGTVATKNVCLEKGLFVVVLRPVAPAPNASVSVYSNSLQRELLNFGVAASRESQWDGFKNDLMECLRFSYRGGHVQARKDVAFKIGIIEAGLVIQELLLRHRARSIFVVCPSSLQEKWRVEMARTIRTRIQARRARAKT